MRLSLDLLVTEIILGTKCLNRDGYFSWNWRIISAIKPKWNTLLSLNLLVFYCKILQKPFDVQHGEKLQVSFYDIIALFLQLNPNDKNDCHLIYSLYDRNN